jgi:hypothetical protein
VNLGRAEFPSIRAFGELDETSIIEGPRPFSTHRELNSPQNGKNLGELVINDTCKQVLQVDLKTDFIVRRYFAYVFDDLS